MFFLSFSLLSFTVYLIRSFNTLIHKLWFYGLFGQMLPSPISWVVLNVFLGCGLPQLLKLWRLTTFSKSKRFLLMRETEKAEDKTPARRSRAPSLAETEEALAHAVWCWAGIATWGSPEHLNNFSDNRSRLLVCLLPQRFSDSSYSLLADDVLGSYLLCPHPKKPKCGSLIIRFPSGLVTHLLENTRTGKFLLEVTVASRNKGTYQATYYVLRFGVGTKP